MVGWLVISSGVHVVLCSRILIRVTCATTTLLLRTRVADVRDPPRFSFSSPAPKPQGEPTPVEYGAKRTCAARRLSVCPSVRPPSTVAVRACRRRVASVVTLRSARRVVSYYETVRRETADGTRRVSRVGSRLAVCAGAARGLGEIRLFACYYST